MQDPPGVAGLLEPLRLRLLRRTLWVLLPLTISLALSYSLSGAPLWPAISGVTAVAIGLACLQARPGRRAVVAWVTGWTGLGLLWVGHVRTGFMAVPVLAVLPALCALVEGPALGLLMLAGCGALLFQLSLDPGLTYVAGLRLVVTGATAYMALGSVLGWSWGLRKALASTVDARQALNATVIRRDALARALFVDVAAAQANLASLLDGDGEPDWGAVKAQVAALDANTQGFKQLRQSLTQPAALSVPADFSAPVLRALLWFYLTLGLPAFYYHVILGRGPWWISVVLVGVCAAGLWALRGAAQAPRWVAWAWTIAAVLPLVHDLARDRGTLLTATLVGWCGCVMQAALLLDSRVAVVLAVLGVAGTVDAGLALAPAAAWPVVAGHVFALGLVLLALLQAVDGQRRVLASLESERQALARGLAQHRRYLGTLFHDIANPLGALGLLCDEGLAGQAEPGDVQRARRLVERLRLLLQESRPWLLGEAPPPAAGAETVGLQQLVDDLNEVFRERLARKGLQLTTDLPAGLRARGRASALRESVVANLLSNAIKFSPPGGIVELRAWREAKHVHLELADRGPGLPDGLRQALAEGQDLPSRNGSAGESGQGLGLALAQELLLRMGGELALLDRAGGGLLARITLEAA